MVPDGHSPSFTRKRRAARFVTVLSAAAISACAQTDGTALPLDAPQLSQPEDVSAIRREYRVTSATDDTIALTEWHPDGSPKAVILAVHGYGDYGSSTFDAPASDWAKQGIVTYAYDQRGFGRNPSNGDWPGHEALVRDLEQISGLIGDRHEGLPLVLIGHSMGGAVVATALGEQRVQVDRAVLLAPALWGGPYLSGMLRAMARIANTVAPDKRWTGDGIVQIQASDNIEMLRGLGRDPLYVRNPSSREFVGLIQIMDRAVDSAPSNRTPTLVIYGAKDEVIPEEPIVSAFKQFAGVKRYEKVETGWHMLLRDLEAEKVRTLVADFALGNES